MKENFIPALHESISDAQLDAELARIKRKQRSKQKRQLAKQK